MHPRVNCCQFHPGCVSDAHFYPRPSHTSSSHRNKPALTHPHRDGDTHTHLDLPIRKDNLPDPPVSQDCKPGEPCLIASTVLHAS